MSGGATTLILLYACSELHCAPSTAHVFVLCLNFLIFSAPPSRCPNSTTLCLFFPIIPLNQTTTAGEQHLFIRRVSRSWFGCDLIMSLFSFSLPADVCDG